MAAHAKLIASAIFLSFITSCAAGTGSINAEGITPRSDQSTSAEGFSPTSIRKRLIEQGLECRGTQEKQYEINRSIHCDADMIISVYNTSQDYEAAVKYHKSQQTAIAGQKPWLLISEDPKRLEFYAKKLDIHTE
ncbi:hypothetical protein [Kocuria sp. U4B]